MVRVDDNFRPNSSEAIRQALIEGASVISTQRVYGEDIRAGWPLVTILTRLRQPAL